MTEAMAAPAIPSGGIPPPSENQQVVQHHVRQDHDHRIGRQDTGIGRPDVEGAEHRRGERKEEPERTVAEIRLGGGADRPRLDQMSQQPRRQGPRHPEKENGHAQQKPHSLHEDRPDSCEIAFAVAARDKHLRTDAEPEPHHEDRQVEDARNGRRTQLDLAHMAQVDRVGQPDELLHHQTQQHGEGYFQNLSIGKTHRRLNFGDTKIGIKPGAKANFGCILPKRSIRSEAKDTKIGKKSPAFPPDGVTSVAERQYR